MGLFFLLYSLHRPLMHQSIVVVSTATLKVLLSFAMTRGASATFSLDGQDVHTTTKFLRIHLSTSGQLSISALIGRFGIQEEFLVYGSRIPQAMWLRNFKRAQGFQLCNEASPSHFQTHNWNSQRKIPLASIN